MLEPRRPNRADFPRSHPDATHPTQPATPAVRDHSARPVFQSARGDHGTCCRWCRGRRPPRKVSAAPLKYARNPRFSLKEDPNSLEDITTYNNFYEFGTDKADPARNAGKLQAAAVDRGGRRRGGEAGHATRSTTSCKPHALEERIYRLRCVEAWSMVIPWVGFPLGDVHQALRADLEAPSTSSSRRSSTRTQMPGQRRRGARLAVRRRAAHGRGHAPADAAGRRPVRRDAAQPERRAAAAGGAVEVRLQGHQVDRARSASPNASRATTWNVSAPREYGFYANVNPSGGPPALEPGAGAAHRRGLFASSARRCRSTATPTRWRRSTAGMDLRKFY